jgi:F-type H+-transporting ATPase subunit c
MELEAARLMAAAISMGLGSIGSGIGEGMIGSKAIESMARNPEMSDKLFTNMLISMAICESTAIYALLVSFIILFAV